jgi:beta-lactamase regulating signal transducer with metallopeptidase domain
MVSELIELLTRTTVAGSIAALVAIALRLPLRRWFGSGVAYAVWLVVPSCVLAVLAPKPTLAVPSLGIASFAYAVVDTMPGATSVSHVTWPEVLLVVWACGAASMAIWQAHLQRAFVKRLGPLDLEGDLARFGSASAGPALLGLWRPVIAVPADFESRYTRDERDLILAHERAHARNGDPFVNLVCAVCRCVWWFDPLVHVSASLLRLDQELARDADVVRAFPGARRAYADAMLKTQVASTFDSPVACRWESRHPFKERIMNLARRPSDTARTIGRIVLGVALAGGTYAVWAEQGTPSLRPADWSDARPSSTITVAAGPKPGQFLVSTTITDLATSRILGEPRLLTNADVPATMEIGTNHLMMRFVVTVDASGREAAYTSEVRRDDKVESAQSGTLIVQPAGSAQAAALPLGDAASVRGRSPSAEARSFSGNEDGPFAFKLAFASSDSKELACAASVFAARGQSDLAAAMMTSQNGQRHEADFSTTTPTITEDTDQLVASLAKCQLGTDSKLTWSVGRLASSSERVREIRGSSPQ